MKTTLTLWLILLLSSYVLAQNACSCCTQNHEAFDFWLGEWVVKDSSGTVLGHNTITKIESNCALREEWKGAKGSTGTSLNYFHSSDSTWNQVWVDNNGGVLELKGKLEGDAMVLWSELQSNQQGSYYNKISWTPLTNGNVEQEWSIYNADKEYMRTIFLGIYSKF